MESYRLRRVRYGIRLIEIAALAGVSLQAVAYFEQPGHKPHAATKEKYEEALATLIRQRQEAR